MLKRGSPEKSADFKIVGQRVQMNVREFLHEGEKALDIWPYKRIRPQAVRRARLAGKP